MNNVDFDDEALGVETKKIHIKAWEAKTVQKIMTVGLPANAFEIAATNSLVRAFLNLLTQSAMGEIRIHLLKENSSLDQDSDLLTLSFDLIRTFSQSHYSVKTEKEEQKKKGKKGPKTVQSLPSKFTCQIVEIILKQNEDEFPARF